MIKGGTLKARIIVNDAERSNPDFRPPDRRTDPLGYARYTARVSPTLPVPRGTILEGPDCYLHCVPDAGGTIRAEPADEDCADMVAMILGKPLPSLQNRPEAIAHV